MPVDPPPLDPPAIVTILDAHRVEYVVVGGYAAQLHGSSHVTTDIDLTPKRSTTNLQRLAHALGDLGAGIRVDDVEQGLAFDTSAEALAGMKTLNLRTPYGDIDLTFEPDGTGGYPDLIQSAGDHTIGTVHVHVAALADIIRSKTAADRPKDLRALLRAERTHPTAATPTPRQARPQLMPGRREPWLPAKHGSACQVRRQFHRQAL